MTDTEYIHAMTGLTDRDHDRLAGYYAELRPEERIAIHGLHTRIAREKSGKKDRSRLSAYYHATFLLAVREYRMAQNQCLSRRMTMKRASEVDALQKTRKSARTSRKSSAAQTLVEKHYALIEDLREKGKGWRFIAKGLPQKISHTALIRIFKKLQAEGGP